MQAKVLRVLPSGRTVPHIQGFFNFIETICKERKTRNKKLTDPAKLQSILKVRKKKMRH